MMFEEKDFAFQMVWVIEMKTEMVQISCHQEGNHPGLKQQKNHRERNRKGILSNPA